VKNSLSPAILTVLAIPVIQLCFSPAWMYTVDGIDEWIYHGYFLHLKHHIVSFGAGYYGGRLPWILPGFAAHALFGPLTANFVLRLFVYWIAILSVYFLIRRTYGRRCAAICCLLLAGCADFLCAAGWDYVDGAGIAYGLLCVEELTAAAMAQSRKAGAWRAMFAGMAFAAALHTQLFLAILAPVLAAVFLARTGKRGLILALPALGGFAALTGAFGLVDVALRGPFLFFANSLSFGTHVIKADPYYRSPWEWAASAWWLVVPFAVGLASLAFLVRMAARGCGDEPRPARTARLADAAALPLLLLIYCGLVAMHFHALQYPFYASYSLVFAPLAVGALIGRRLDAWSRAGFVRLTCACACLAVLVGADVPSHLPRAAALAYTSVRALPNASAPVLAAVLAAAMVLGSVIRRRLAAAFVVAVATGAVSIHLGGLRLREDVGPAASRAIYLDVDRISRQLGQLSGEGTLWFWYADTPGNAHYDSIGSSYLRSTSQLGNAMPDTANLRFDVAQTGNYVALMDDRESVVEEAIARLRAHGIALSHVAHLPSSVRPGGFGVEVLRVK